MIRETKINEADKMLTLLTEEMGTLSVCAKNIIKNKDALSKEYIDSMIETINFLVNNSLISIHTSLLK